MKKLLLTLLLLPLYVAMHAQDIHVGVEGSRFFTGDNYWQGAVVGSYTKQLPWYVAFDVDASLYYQHYDSTTLDGIWGASHTFGGSVGVNGILKLAGPLSLFTGPKATCNFVQKDYGGHRASLQWRLGIGADFNRIRVRASWDTLITEQSGGKGSAVSVSVALRL